MTSVEIDPRYPVGKFQHPQVITQESRAAAIADLSDLPDKLNEAVSGLDTLQLGTPYRDGGWTVRQVIHHLADSHMTTFVRIKQA
jgi:Mycothiol maleylpyruvate isomerase N-terminal domain